jgi:hypothetical protein
MPFNEAELKLGSCCPTSQPRYETKFEEAEMLKWKLMLTTIPFVVVLVVVKLVLDLIFQVGGFIKFSDIAIVLTGGVFLIGFMLAGTMADYKEAERLPGELVCSLEAIEEGLCHIAVAKQNIGTQDAHKWVLELTHTVRDWLYGKLKSDKVYEAVSAISTKVQQLDATAIGVRVQNELHVLRRNITRIDVIVRTSFIQSGYALLDTIVLLVIVFVMLSKFETALSEGIVTAFVSLVYIYMVRLIRDIDNPFEYKEGKQKGATEVDLFPLSEYLERLEKRAS